MAAPKLPQAALIPVNKSAFNGMDGEQATQNNRPKANVIKSEAKLKIIPLGGLGEVGKNMTALEYDNDIIVVDFGSNFPNDMQPGIDLVVPDMTYLERNKGRVRGWIITHGHMDHMGAAGIAVGKVPAPIFGTRFTLAMAEKRMEEFPLNFKPDFRVMDPDRHEKVQLGQFNVELVRSCHSIPDSAMVFIKCPGGTVLHSGDFRFDSKPIDGRPMDMERLRQIGNDGLTLLLGESTNVTKPGNAPLEADIIPTLDYLIGRASGRVIISAFASNVNRLQMVVDATARAGRRLAIGGRSMITNLELAVSHGYIKLPKGIVMRMQDITGTADHDIVILCTGSQGEDNAVLARMSRGDHPHVKIKAGDSVLFSSNPISGNEPSVTDVIDALMREGARVYQHSTAKIDGHGPLHCTGHAYRDDIAELIRMTKPKYLMPIHGYFFMQSGHAEVGVQNGIPASNVFVLDNGDVLEIDAQSARRGGRVSSGDLLVDGLSIGDIENVVLRDRLALGADGMVVVIVTLNRKTGKLMTSPDIISRGFIHMKDNEELVSKLRYEVRRAFERGEGKQDWQKFKMNMRDDIADFLYGHTRRNPMVLPVINEV